MKIGVIDIGSNSVRMAWIDGKPKFGTLPEERIRYSRFAENATESGALGEEPVARTIEAVQSLLNEAAENDVDIQRISATSALREASNRDEVKALMEEKLERVIRILTPDEEAQYSYNGAVFAIPKDGHMRLVLDIGGGSTELCWGSEPGQSASVPVGAVRLKEAPEKIGPLSLALAPLTAGAPKGNISLIGVGGTLTTMAGVLEQMTTYDPRMIHQAMYGINAIEQMNEIIKTFSMEQRLSLPSMTEARADIITQGLDIALMVMKGLNTNVLTISTTDLLFGQLLELIEEV